MAFAVKEEFLPQTGARLKASGGCIKSSHPKHNARNGLCRGEAVVSVRSDPHHSDPEVPTKSSSKSTLARCTDDGRDCHVLSLEEDFFSRFDFDEFPEDVKGHLCREEWICEFLEENYMRLREDDDIDHLQVKQILERIGFKANGAAVNKLLDRLTALNGHQHILDLAKSYVLDEFKYNPELSERPNLSFPFFPDTCQKWVDGPEGILIINLERRPRTPYLRETIRLQVHQRTENDHQTVLLYHGTDHNSAEFILTSGISVIEGAHKRDFSSGHGFYLTTDLEHSLDWAFSSTRKPAVLVYSADRRKLQSFRAHSLVGFDKENEWKDHVKQYQSGKPTKQLRESMKEYDYVEGPRSARYDPVEPKPEHNTYQMCILSRELAQTMDTFLRLALFFGGD